MFYYYYDWTYILVLIGVVLSLLASAKVKSTFARYSNVRSYSGMTGRDAAEKILHRNGIYDVQIIHISGNLTDHYNPTNKTLALSDPVYHSTSVAAIGVAAHEWWSCSAASGRVCTAFCPFCFSAGGKFWFYDLVAIDHYWTDVQRADVRNADQSGNPVVLTGSPFSDCDFTGRVQCVTPGSKCSGDGRNVAS